MKHTICASMVLASLFVFINTGFTQTNTPQSSVMQSDAKPQDTNLKDKKDVPQGVAENSSPKVAAPEKTQASPSSKDNANPQEDVVKGTVKEIANDKTYIIVDSTKILTTKEFLEDSYLEVGDKIEVSVEKSEQGLRAKSYNYIFEEESVPMNSEEGAANEEAPAEK